MKLNASIWLFITCCLLGGSKLTQAEDTSDWLAQKAVQWVSSDQNIPEVLIDVTTPDRRARLRRCELNLSFSWPFESNLRTLESACEKPTWRYYLQVKIDKHQTVIGARRDLAVGTILTEQDLENIPVAELSQDMINQYEKIIGATLMNPRRAGDPLRTSDIHFYTNQFVTQRAYQAGEIVELSDLLVESTQAGSPESLSQWPRGQVIAARQLSEGQKLTSDDVDTAISVVVAKENIIRNQVITADLVTTEWVGNIALGTKPMTDPASVIGFEATRTIQAGTRLKPSDLRAADLVREGEKVTLTIEKGALSITVDAIATEDAKMAEQVILINPDSGREIRGVVTGRNQARGL